MAHCYLCRNADDAFIKGIPTYVAEKVGGMHMQEVCVQISEALREQKGVDVPARDVHEHVTRHICDKRIDACVALQELNLRGCEKLRRQRLPASVRALEANGLLIQFSPPRRSCCVVA